MPGPTTPPPPPYPPEVRLPLSLRHVPRQRHRRRRRRLTPTYLPTYLYPISGVVRFRHIPPAPPLPALMPPPNLVHALYRVTQNRRRRLTVPLGIRRAVASICSNLSRDTPRCKSGRTKETRAPRRQDSFFSSVLLFGVAPKRPGALILRKIPRRFHDVLRRRPLTTSPSFV